MECRVSQHLQYRPSSWHLALSLVRERRHIAAGMEFVPHEVAQSG